MTKLVFFVLFFVVSYTESSFLDSLQKCYMKDLKCLKQVAESIMYNMTDNGIPEMGIPILDPVQIFDKTMSINGLMDITMIEGSAEGMRNCKLESFHTSIETKITKFNIFCDLMTMKGSYIVKSAPVVDLIFGNVMSGNGNGGVIIEKLIMNFTNPYTVEMIDGNIHLVPDFDKASYDYEILDKVTFSADSLKLGDLEIAPAVTKFMNSNWPHVVNSFGRFFSDKSMSISYKFATLFFKSVAAKKFILDDLSQHVTEKLRCS